MLDMDDYLDMNDYEDQPLGYLLHRVMAALRPQVTAELKSLGIGLPEFVCMRILSMSPGRSNAELARDTSVTPQAMNLVLRGLEELGAVARPASVASGRALPAHLTGKGRALLKRAEMAVLAGDERILTHLSAAERRELKRLLYAASSRLSEAGGPSCF
jgi:DNA-binding MarR family transcriptional regulator